jgi:branched-chain amino acid transport system permease protein
LSTLTGWSGQVSIGTAGFMAVGAFSAAILLRDYPHATVIGTLLVATLCGALTGLIVGLPATRLRGPYLAGMTLAFGYAVPQLIQNGGAFTGGSAGLQLPRLVAPGWFTNLVGSSNPFAVDQQWISIVTILVVGVSFFGLSNLFTSRFGMSMRLVRDNEVAAELAGLRLSRVRVSAFIISAAFAGLSGGLLALVRGGVSPQDFSPGLSITLLALMVLGGIGTLPGAILAGIFSAYSDTVVTWLTNLFGIDPASSFGANLKGMIFGILLVVTMLTAPRGVVGVLSDIRHKTARLVARK